MDARTTIGLTASRFFAATGLPACSWGRCDGDSNVVKARDLAARRADEVRMVLGHDSVMPRTLDLEPPDVIPEFDPGDEFGFGEFREIAVDRGPVEAPVCERFGNLRMRPRTHGGVEVLHDGQTGGRTPQSGGADACFDGLGW